MIKCLPCNSGSKALDKTQINQLVKQLNSRWVTSDLKFLHAEFKFKNFVIALDFVNQIGNIAEDLGHHPDIELGYGYVNLRIQTHAIKALHQNDFILAGEIDRISI